MWMIRWSSLKMCKHKVKKEFNCFNGSKSVWRGVKLEGNICSVRNGLICLPFYGASDPLRSSCCPLLPSHSHTHSNASKFIESLSTFYTRPLLFSGDSGQAGLRVAKRHLHIFDSYWNALGIFFFLQTTEKKETFNMYFGLKTKNWEKLHRKQGKKPLQKYWKKSEGPQICWAWICSGDCAVIRWQTDFHKWAHMQKKIQ